MNTIQKTFILIIFSQMFIHELSAAAEQQKKTSPISVQRKLHPPKAKAHHTPISQRRRLSVNDSVAAKKQADLVSEIEEALMSSDVPKIEALYKENQAIFKHKYANGGGTFMHFAAGLNDPSLINVLREKGIDIDETNAVGKTALHIAVNNNAEKNVEALLKAKAKNNIIDAEKRTPLDETDENKNPNIIKLLTDDGAKRFQELTAQPASAAAQAK